MSKAKIKIPLLGISIVLTTVFAILKYLGIITWSWWWVFSPMIFTGIFAAFLLVAFFLSLIYFITLLLIYFFEKKL
jgi:hypothetical protein